MLIALANHTEKICWYDFKDDGLDLNYNEASFGMVHHEQFALALRQVLRRFDDRLDVEVAYIARTQHRHALAANLELTAGLRALRHFHAAFAAARLASCGYL